MAEFVSAYKPSAVERLRLLPLVHRVDPASGVARCGESNAWRPWLPVPRAAFPVYCYRCFPPARAMEGA